MHSHKTSYKIGEKGALVGIAVNLVLGIFKFIAGIIGQSNAMLADALHTGSDLLTSVVVYIGFKIAQIPPDEHHPYGHAKAESIAAKVVSLILIILGLKVFLGSFHILACHKFYKPGLIALIAATISIVVKYSMFLYAYMLGKRIKSASLIADSYHHKADALSSIAAFIGIFAARMGLKFMDPLCGIIIAGFVIKTGIEVFHMAYDELLDAAPPRELEDITREAVMAAEGVKGIKKLNVRKQGIDFHVDLIIDVDKNMNVEEAHIITMKVKRNIIKNLPGAKRILIHVEPYKESS